jgi:hypothetical protein
MSAESIKGVMRQPFAWALLLGALMLALPLWIAPMPAMPDYPAHLASFALLSGAAKSPLLAQFFRVDWTPVPNLAGEIVIPALGSLLGLKAATALFLTFGVVAWVIAGGAIQWTLFRHVSPAPLLGSIFAYNANFMWGFFNYSFGAALALLAFSGWIVAERRFRLWHIACFSVAVLAIYFCHLFAAAVLLLLVGCYQLSGISRPLSSAKLARGLWPAIAVAMPSVVAFVFFKPAAGDASIEFNIIDTVIDRLSSAVQFTFDQPAWLLLAAAIAFLGFGIWSRLVLFHPRMKLVLFVLLLACVVAPEWAMGGWGVDLRLPALLGTLAFASAELRLTRHVQLALAAVAMLVAAWQSAALAGNWLYYDRRFAEFRAADTMLKPGSKLLTVLDGDAMGLASDQPYWHMAEYAIIDRAAFTPLLFTTRAQHVIELTPAGSAIAATSAQQGSPPDISELDDLANGNTRDDPDIREVFPYLLRFQCHFDVVVVIHLGGHRSSVPDTLVPMHDGSFFSFYRTRHDENCGTR